MVEAQNAGQPFQLGVQGQELTIAKVENTLAALEQSDMMADPRYYKTMQLKAKLAGKKLWSFFKSLVWRKTEI